TRSQPAPPLAFLPQEFVGKDAGDDSAQSVRNLHDMQHGLAHGQQSPVQDCAHRENDDSEEQRSQYDPPLRKYGQARDIQRAIAVPLIGGRCGWDTAEIHEGLRSLYPSSAVSAAQPRHQCKVKILSSTKSNPTPRKTTRAILIPGSRLTSGMRSDAAT